MLVLYGTLKLMKRAQTSKGFTIVELLIVVVVIAILAAITIVAYNGIQQRAKDSAAQSTASQAGKKLASYAVLNAELFPTTTTFNTSTGLSDGDGTSYQYSVSNDLKTFCLTATKSNVSYSVSNTNLTPKKGACDGHGANGVAPITNLAIDPRATSTLTAPNAIGWKQSRWAGVSGATNHSFITGASDGPVSGLSTYIRKTWTTSPSTMPNSGDTGFDITSGAGTFGYQVTPGQEFTFSCYLRPSVVRNFEIGVYQYLSNGSVHSTPRVRSATFTGQANQWTRLTYTYTVPATVSYIALACDSTANALSGAVNWTPNSTLDGTGLMVTEGSTIYNFADGNSTGWAWKGGANASQSTGPAI